MGGQLAKETDWSATKTRSSTLPSKSRYAHVRILFPFPSSERYKAYTQPQGAVLLLARKGMSVRPYVWNKQKARKP